MRLNIVKLNKSFDEHNVLIDLSVLIENRQSLVIIGPSGGGKTTLLRILSGLEKPQSGKIELNDNEIVFEENLLRDYRKKIGMVFQSYNLFPHLTALNNITMPLIKVHKYDKKTAEQKAHELLRRFNLHDHWHKKPAEMSGGQKQRVALCRAIAIKPEVLFLDEPTSALDPEYTVEVLNLIEELRMENIELIMITHEMGFARSIADHVLFIDEGKILTHGSPEEVFNSEIPRVNKFFSDILKYDK